MSEAVDKQDRPQPCQAAYTGARYPELHGTRCTKNHWQHSTHWHAAWVNEGTGNRFRLTWRES